VSRFDVKIDGLNGTYFIHVSDDGKPFDFYQMLQKSTGTGLKNIASRLRVIGATLNPRATTEGNDFLITLKRKK